jgi:hypothetical protein
MNEATPSHLAQAIEKLVLDKVKAEQESRESRVRTEAAWGVVRQQERRIVELEELLAVERRTSESLRRRQPQTALQQSLQSGEYARLGDTDDLNPVDAAVEAGELRAQDPHYTRLV